MEYKLPYNANKFYIENIRDKDLTERQIKTRIKKFINENYTNAYTKNGLWTKFRNTMNKKWVYPTEWIDEQKKIQDNKLDNKEIIKVELSKIEDLINKDLMSITNKYELLFILLLISGRRFSDVLESDFIYKNKKIYYRPRKKRDDDNEIYEIKVILGNTSKLRFVKFINYIKELIEDLSIATIRAGLGNVIKRYDLPFTNKQTRDVYANYATRNITNAGKKILKIKDLLNHEFSNSSVNYSFIEFI